MAHGRQVIDFIRLYFLDQAGEVGAVRHVPVVEAEPHIFFVRVLVKVVYPFRIERRSTALHPMHFIAFCQQEFTEVSAILSGYPCDQGNLCFIHGLCFCCLRRGA